MPDRASPAAPSSWRPADRWPGGRVLDSRPIAMCSPSRPTLFLLLAATLATSAGASQHAFDALAGSWHSPPTAASGEARTHASFGVVLPGAWVQLTVKDVYSDGREHGEALVLRQPADGSVIGYLFTGADEKPRRLTGRWVEPGRLELTGDDPAERWSWRRESSCRAILTRTVADSRPAGRTAEAELTLVECDEAQMAAAPAPPEAETPAAGPEGRPVGAQPAESSDTPAEKPVAPQPASRTDVEVADLPTARPVAAQPASDTAAVLVAGRGKPFDEVKKAVGLLREFLTENGVAVETPSDEIVVLQAAESSLAYLVREVRDRGAASLIYVEAAFGGRERIIVECYDGNGLLLWSEKTVGGTGMRQFQWMNPRLVERIEEKLLARIGGPGLPANGAANPSP